MKRKELAKFNGTTKTFVGHIAKYGTRKIKNKKHKTVVIKTALIRDVTDINGNKMTGHIWIDWNRKPCYPVGSKIMFDALVKEYIKGYKGNARKAPYFATPMELDFGLKNPKNVKKINAETRVPAFA